MSLVCISTKQTYQVDKRILIRFLNGMSSAEEATQVKAWLDLPGSKEKLDAVLEENWENTSESKEDELLNHILSSIHKEIKKPQKRYKSLNFPLFFRAAAILLIISSVIFGSYKLTNQVEQIDKEVLTVFTRTTKAGEKLKMRLPDKSYVILNSNSTMVFDSDFGKEERKVSLIGEAFFEVASNKDIPFKVYSGDLVTTAIGTEFNVFAREGVEKIALTEGKVKVELNDLTSDQANAKFLTPGIMASLDEDEGGIITGDFDPKVLTAWKEGSLRFKRKKLQDILENLETWYGVEIDVKNKVNLNRRVSGEFNNDNLESILEGLSFSLDFKFSISDTTVILTQ